MVKFEKQVAKNKTSYLLKKSPLIIFLHCINKKTFYELLVKKLLVKDLQNLQKNNNKKINDSFSIAEIENILAVEGFIIKSVKNSYAKLALMENEALTNKANPSFFRARSLLLAFKDLSLLTIFKHIIEDKELDVLGAIYENKYVLDFKQIKTLASISENKIPYVSLIKTLQIIKTRPHYQLTNVLDFSYLLQNQYLLLSIAKASAIAPKKKETETFLSK